MTTQTNNKFATLVNNSKVKAKDMLGEWKPALQETGRVVEHTNETAAALTALTIRAAAVSLEATSIGAKVALDKTPATYQETKELLASLFSEEEQAEPAQ